MTFLYAILTLALWIYIYRYLKQEVDSVQRQQQKLVFSLPSTPKETSTRGDNVIDLNEARKRIDESKGVKDV